MSKPVTSRFFIKLTLRLLIFAIILPGSLRAQADTTAIEAESSLDIEALAEEISQADAAIVASPTFLSAFRVVDKLKALGEDAPMWAKPGLLSGTFLAANLLGTALFIESALNPANALEGAFAARDIENNKKIQAYYRVLWGEFLNDPFYMGPSETDANTMYIRDVFNQAAKRVNEALDKSKLYCCINPDHVFLSESFESYYETRNGRAYFFVPATTFFTGDRNDKINKVALVLISQLGSYFYNRHIEKPTTAEDIETNKIRDKIIDIMQSHSPDGTHRSMFSAADSMLYFDALKFWGTQVLDYQGQKIPMPNFKKRDFEVFQEDYKYYQIESDPRNVFHRPFRTPSIRPGAIATTKGPQTGAIGTSPCTVPGQELVIGHPLFKCREIRLAFLENPKIKKHVNDLITSEGKKEYTGRGAELFKKMSGITLALMTAQVVNKGLASTKVGGNWKGKLFGFILSTGAYFAGEEGANLLIHSGPNVGGFFKLPETQLKKALEDLANYKGYLGPDAEGDPHSLQKSLNSIFTTTDPETVKTLLMLSEDVPSQSP